VIAGTRLAMSRASRILELFEEHYPWTKEPNTGRFHDYHFKTEEGQEYTVDMTHPEDDHDPAIVEFNAEHMPAYNPALGAASQSPYGITGMGRGHSQKIFSTVHHILKTHLQNHPEIKAIQFDASEPSRQKLYAHLAKRFATKVHIGHQGRRFTIKRRDMKELTDA